MLTKLWEGVGSELVSRWVAQVLTPAFLFWLGGLGVWIWSRRGWSELESLFDELLALPGPRQAALVIAALLLLIASGAIARALSLPVLRLLEGYWPRWSRPVRDFFARRRWAERQEDERDWQAIAGGDAEGWSAADKDEMVRLDRQLRRVPERVDRCMPTRLGNVLRASEARPTDKYGLEAVVCWPRLFLLLPGETKKELAAARARLDTGAQSWLWSLLFLAWVPVAPWLAVVVALGGMLLSYRFTLGAAETFGDLVESTFDLHRFELYEKLRWPLPENPFRERGLGEQLSAYLYRGSDSPRPRFVD